jgi:hypothetical protein
MPYRTPYLPREKPALHSKFWEFNIVINNRASSKNKKHSAHAERSLPAVLFALLR